MSAATLGLFLINRDDDRWKNLPDWEKLMFWHTWVGDKQIRVPKPFEMGAIFGSIPELMFEKMSGDRNFEELDTVRILGLY